MRLANGAEIVYLEVRPGHRGERKWVGKVLAHLPLNPLHPYVVWGVASSDEDEHVFDCFAGDYFEHQSTARAAYLERSEEHTSELQSRENLVCRLLLEKKKFKLSSCIRF